MKTPRNFVLEIYNENKNDLFSQGLFLGYFEAKLNLLEFRFKNVMFKTKSLRNDLWIINNVRTECFDDMKILSNLEPFDNNVATIKTTVLKEYENLYIKTKLNQ